MTIVSFTHGVLKIVRFHHNGIIIEVAFADVEIKMWIEAEG